MKENEEERLRAEFTPREETNVEKALKLERKMKLPALIFAYTYGIVGALILGVGMCLAMEVLATGTWAMVVGIIVGLVGILMVATNYPIYGRILRSRKEKYASRILVLLNEEKKD